MVKNNKCGGEIKMKTAQLRVDVMILICIINIEIALQDTTIYTTPKSNIVFILSMSSH